MQAKTLSGWLMVPNTRIDLWRTISAGKWCLGHILIEGAWDVWGLQPSLPDKWLVVEVTNHRNGVLRCVKQAGTLKAAYKELRRLTRSRNWWQAYLFNNRFGLLTENQQQLYFKQ